MTSQNGWKPTGGKRPTFPEGVVNIWLAHHTGSIYFKKVYALDDDLWEYFPHWMPAEVPQPPVEQTTNTREQEHD